MIISYTPDATDAAAHRMAGSNLPFDRRDETGWDVAFVEATGRRFIAVHARKLFLEVSSLGPPDDALVQFASTLLNVVLTGRLRYSWECGVGPFVSSFESQAAKLIDQRHVFLPLDLLPQG